METLNQELIDYRKSLIDTMLPDNESEENPHLPTEEEFEKAETELRNSFDKSIDKCIENNDVKGLIYQLGQFAGLVDPKGEFDNGDNEWNKPFDCCDIVSLILHLCEKQGFNRKELVNMYDNTKPYPVSDSSSECSIDSDLCLDSNPLDSDGDPIFYCHSIDEDCE